MLEETVCGLMERYPYEGHPYEIEMKGGLVKVELRVSPSGACSLLTSEKENPVGYLDFSRSGNSRNSFYHNVVETPRGHLADTGYVADDRFSYHSDFDEVNGGFKGHSPSWAFFINEQYRGKGIGALMFSIALGIARVLSQPRPLTQKEIDEIDWDYLGGQPPKIDEQKARLGLNEAFFMVYKIVSGFFPAYFANGSNSLRGGVEFYEEYSGFSSALVFPDFQIPQLAGVKQLKRLEVQKLIYW